MERGRIGGPRRWLGAWLAAFLLGPAPAWGTGAPDYARRHDLLITDARIVDGTGGPSLNGDLLVDGDTISFIGAVDRARVKAVRTIAADGRVVSPGFIDMHAHGNPVKPEQSFDNFVAQGVTTIVLGQDGETPGGSNTRYASLPDWMAAVDRRPLMLNVAALVGHGTIRIGAGAVDEGPMTAEQKATMGRLLEEGLAAGAYGMSLGLEYVPGIHSTPEELDGLAAIVGRADGVIVSHMRTEDSGRIAGAIDELLRHGADTRVHISHIKIVLGKRADEAAAVLAQLDRARARGIAVTADAYPYLAGFNDLELVYPPWTRTREDFDRAAKQRRAELEAYIAGRIGQRNGPGAILFAMPPYAGKTLADLAKERGERFEKVAVDLGYGGPLAAHFIMSPAIQDAFLLDDHVTIGTDGGPTIAHPRSYGTYAKIIQDYVAGTGRLTLEKAIHKMSGLPAQVLGLSDRGVLRAGARADIVMFDPAAVRTAASWETPRTLAQGFDLVLVNGQAAYQDGRASEGRFGRLLRRHATSAKGAP